MVIKRFFKNNIDLTLAIIFAAITCLIAPPSASLVIRRLNIPLLGLLIALMCIVAGFRLSGFFDAIIQRFFKGDVTERSVARFFIFACYFSSMLITNDVALIIFVPTAIFTFTKLNRVRVIAPTVVLATIAANLGSMLTPIGNPQNLFIYSRYTLSLNEFLSITAPFVVLSGVIICLATFFLPNSRIKIRIGKNKKLPVKNLGFLAILFLLCLLHVIRLIPFSILALIVFPSIFLLNRKLFLKADYKLIFLFATLFIGVGNLSEIQFFKNISQILSGHEMAVSIILSQIISNVPATVLLSEFTNSYEPLLIGVNIGGLVTIIASMASLISFKAYMEMRFSKMGYYLILFTLGNLFMLAILLAYYKILY
ncbi:MAG: hypothetical protein IKN12_00270 [Selenomonadaceae bacterium]|nr:hypothetical protein [Selenomonadaceae bacterium]